MLRRIRKVHNSVWWKVDIAKKSEPQINLIFMITQINAAYYTIRVNQINLLNQSLRWGDWHHRR